MTREQHLAWAKERALEYLDAGHDPAHTAASMISDLRKHEETRELIPELLHRGTQAVLDDAAEALSDAPRVRRWIAEIT
jgi:hypothetical protein